MSAKKSGWETELWSYLSRGDGINCPVYESCKLRLRGTWCLSDHQDYYEARNKLIDEDDLADTPGIEFKLPNCPESGRIFQLITRLATKYLVEAGIDRPPVPSNIITHDYDNIPIEVREVPLKAYHGALWGLSSCWVIQLSSYDKPARQRFTLYHEIFHILAHCRSTPLFKKSSGREGSFNELLADHFAAVMLLPEEWVREKWTEVKDLSKMATIFDVPKPVMYLSLRGMGLRA